MLLSLYIRPKCAHEQPRKTTKTRVASSGAHFCGLPVCAMMVIEFLLSFAICFATNTHSHTRAPKNQYRSLLNYVRMALARNNHAEICLLSASSSPSECATVFTTGFRQCLTKHHLGGLLCALVRSVRAQHTPITHNPIIAHNQHYIH